VRQVYNPACKKEHRRSSCTNALPSNDASPLEVPAAQTPNGMVNCIYESSRGCIWRRVEGADFASASPFVALTLPMLPAPSTISRLYSRVAHPFREPLHSIVMSVISVICLYLKGCSVTVNSWHVRGPSCHRHIYRHCGNRRDKRLSRYHDGCDAHDDDIRAYSRQGVHLYFVGHLTLST
jgi:hypothetical protein